jgi:ATP-dependent protease HslVU (ClpYQ) peptidase subunit
VINDQVLKLHLNDRREEYRQLYENKIITALAGSRNGGRNLEKIKPGIKTDQDKL